MADLTPAERLKFTNRRNVLRELRGWMLNEECKAERDSGDTSWFREVRSTLDGCVEEAERRLG